MRTNVVTSFLVLVILQIGKVHLAPNIRFAWFFLHFHVIMGNIFFNVALVLIAELGKLHGLAHLRSVYEPGQQQLNIWMLCV